MDLSLSATKKLLLKLLFPTIFALQSCGIVHRQILAEIDQDKSSIPPDIGKDDTYVLVVLAGRNSHDNYLRKPFRNRYLGKYEFISGNELNSGKYADSLLYRYVFLGNTSIGTASRMHGGGSTMVHHHSYWIKDRVTGITHNPHIYSSYFGAYIKAYVINLEKARLKNNPLPAGATLE